MTASDLVAQVGNASLSLVDQFERSFELLGILLTYSPYWAPPFLLIIFFHVWMRYVRAQFIESQEYVLLELRIPQEVMKSPAAMQAVFDGLWQKGGESTFIDRLWLGKVRVWYSLELVSIEGQVHFYLWVRKPFKRIVERTFYAHYPEIEITQVADYATAFPFTLETHNLYGSDYELGSAIGVPIKTYSEYHLDQSSMKEEQKVDPMTHILEFLGSMGKGEYLWIQILCRASKKEDLTFGLKFSRNVKSFEQLAKEEMARIRKEPEDTIVFLDGKVGKTLSDKQRKRLEAINRTLLTSTHWDVGIRAIYSALHENFDGINVTGLMSMWQPFGSPGYNQIVPVGSRWQNMFDYPWQDYNGIRENKKKIGILDAYRRRSWFHAPYRFKHYMMTSEELATLFHIPGSVAKTPTMQRITSTRAQAPANLPI